jgi:hypothetical protein
MMDDGHQRAKAVSVDSPIEHKQGGMGQFVFQDQVGGKAPEPSEQGKRGIEKQCRSPGDPGKGEYFNVITLFPEIIDKHSVIEEPAGYRLQLPVEEEPDSHRKASE